MTVLCETCSKEFGSVACPQCKEEILRLGPYCYLCGAELVVVEEHDAGPAEEDDDFSKRVLCTDGACIGVIDEKGVCKVCGKPYVPDAD